MSKRYVVIMAGGSGERFWPESRRVRPKQLLPIVGDEPMLTQTVKRLDDLISPERIFVITNRDQRSAVLETCPMLDPDKVVGEPVGRDTAAAVGLATILVRQLEPEACFAMLPADAVIHDAAGLRSTLESAFAAAEADPAMLVTIGIGATFPATGYGYIQQGSAIGTRAGRETFAVSRFVEKPDLETAERYLASGNYFWNAGIFVWSVGAISGELARHTPTLWASLSAIGAALEDGRSLDACLAEHYPPLEKISIDYAVIEKAERVAMVPAGFDWDDVGEWSALARHFPADEAGNVTRGLVRLEASSNNIVFSREPDHLVALVGADDLIVVKTPDATLVCHKDRAQAIKALVKSLGAEEALRRLV